ncbi:unnamed protein product [Phytomonas sp. EM1]|nr:unnamed protein product [Phytomonas sp. EM1]|eukprot:CCW59956.1 unnamed protein product [Phytomonas sp. isolate EM1]
MRSHGGDGLSQVSHEGVRRSVTLVDPAAAQDVAVLLWLDVTEDGDGEGVPLAVRGRLSIGVVEAAATEAGRAETGIPPSTVGGSPSEGSPTATDQAESALIWYAERLRRELMHKRVIISGMIRVEQRYDADADKFIEVPYIQLPRDGLRMSYHIIS